MTFSTADTLRSAVPLEKVYILKPFRKPATAIGRQASLSIPNDVRANLYPIMPRHCKAMGEIYVLGPPPNDSQILAALSARQITTTTTAATTTTPSPAPTLEGGSFVRQELPTDPFLNDTKTRQFPLGISATGRARFVPNEFGRASTRRFVRRCNEEEASLKGTRYATQQAFHANRVNSTYKADLTRASTPTTSTVPSPSTPSATASTASHGEPTEDSTTSSMPFVGILESHVPTKPTTVLPYRQKTCGAKQTAFSRRQFEVAAAAAFQDSFMIHCCKRLGRKRWLHGMSVRRVRVLLMALERAYERFRSLQTLFGKFGTQEHILELGRQQGHLPQCLYLAIDMYTITRVSTDDTSDTDSDASESTLFTEWESEQSEYDPPCRLIDAKKTPADAPAATPAPIEPGWTELQRKVNAILAGPQVQPTLREVETTGTGTPLASTTNEQADLDNESTQDSTSLLETEESEDLSTISDTAFLEPEELSDARTEDWSQVPTRHSTTIDEATPAPASDAGSTLTSLSSAASSIASTITSTISSLCSAVVEKVKWALGRL